MTKVIENCGNRSELTVSTDQNFGKKSVKLWPEYGYFNTQYCNFLIEKANLPENAIFPINQGYQSKKDGKNIYYTDVFIIA